MSVTDSGFLLNALLKRLKPCSAVTIDAFMFAFIHYPGWIFNSGLDFMGILFNTLGILPVSVLFAFSFIKTKNILVPIFLHMIWNFLMVLFVT